MEIGLANTYVAEGQTHKAEDALASLGPVSNFTDDYDYMLAAANLYRQRQDTVHALSSFVQANTVAGQDNQAMTQTAQNEVAIEEGHEINQNISLAPEASFAPALEDINVYTLDAEILRVTNSPALLPPPRHSFQNLADTHYRIHLGGFPVISGFVGESFTTGRFLSPARTLFRTATLMTLISTGELRRFFILARTRSPSTAACNTIFAATRFRRCT